MSEGNKKDRRITRTEKAIRDAFLDLLKKKGFEATTVSDIVETSDINRGTFYLHYKDKFDLLDKMQTELLDNLTLQLKKASEESGTFSNSDEEYEVFQDYVLRYTNVLWENADQIKLFFNMEGDFDFKEKLKEHLTDNLSNGRYPYVKICNAEVPSEYIYAYMGGGGIGILTKWINDGMREKPKELTDIFLKLHTRGVQHVMHPEMNS